jgi:hypothetical protein
MTGTLVPPTDDTVFGVTQPVRKHVLVRVSARRAFELFTDQMDSWWPKTHHIGSSPARRIVVEGFEGGRVYTEQEDGTECPWGAVLVWEPPRRFVMAWRVSPSWQYEEDLAKCSEVHVQFEELPEGGTNVTLEHRYLHRHGEAWETLRNAVDREEGWQLLLQLYADAVERG